MDLIRKGMSGVSVGRLQQILVEANYAISSIETQQFAFGDSTYDALKAFQASHLGPSGHPLSEDGVVGAETWYALQHPGHEGGDYTLPEWRCELSQVREQVRRVLEVAVGEIGIHEIPDGSNDSPRIRTYTAPDFIGSPWCALFASYCFSMLDGGSPFGRIAATWALYEWAQKNNRVLSAAASPSPGDVFLILRGDQYDSVNRRGHTGIICGVLDDGRLASIEGNASNAVRGGIRNRHDVSAIIRPVPLI